MDLTREGKPFMSLKECAEYFGVDYKTVYRLVIAGELPAARIGGVYRIRKSEADEYFERHKRLVVEEMQKGKGGEEAMAEEFLEKGEGQASCGRCRRLIRSREMVAGQCQRQGCGEVLCSRCWANAADRFCRSHRLSREEKIASARARRDRGELPLVVTAAEAREAELRFISRFDQKVRSLAHVLNPLDGILYPVTSWDDEHREGDELAQVKSELEAADSELPLSSLPRNTWSEYTVGPWVGRKGHRGGLTLLARCRGHLKAYVHDGFDSAPLSLEELLALLDQIVAKAKEEDRLYIAGLASPTGWRPEAQRAVLGTASGTAFSSLYLSVCLVDLAANHLIFNPLDRRLRPFVDLFSSEFRDERVVKVMEHIRGQLATRESQSVEEVAQATGAEMSIVNEAFALLESEGDFILDHIPDVGLVISKR